MDYSKDANTKKQKNKKNTTKKVKNRVGLIIMRVFLIAIVVGFFAVLGAGMGAYLGIINNAPDVSILEVVPKNYTSYIVDKSGNELASLHYEQNREYVKISEIPEDLKNATIAIEDERFYSHNGVDFKGMVRAFFVTLETKLTGSGRIEGASTITQQLIKANFFEEALQGGKERLDFSRKLKEQYMAVVLEKQTVENNGGNKKLAKDQILELYLNTINYGGGAHGVQAAAKRFFGKDASELTLAECASLAAAPNSPSRYNPSNKENNKKRQELVLKNMKDQNYITQEEYNQAKNEDIYTTVENVTEEVKLEASIPNTYYVDQIIEDVTKDLQEQKSVTKQMATNMIFNSGYTIEACIDNEMQAIVDEAYKNPNLFPKDEFAYEVRYFISVKDKNSDEQHHYNKKSEKYLYTEEAIKAFEDSTRAEYLTDDVELVAERTEVVIQPQSAFIITDYHTGEVKAVIGGRGEKLASLTFNRATQAKRQPGSTFKVLTAYAPGIDTGILTPATVFDDSPYKKGKWSPGNWYSGYRGPSTVRKGIEYSMNIVAARAIDKIGMDTAFDYLLNFGFTTLVDIGDRTDGKSDRNDATVLGGLTDGVYLSELNSAYGTIANGGQYLKPIFYTKVIDREGNIVLENKPEPRTVLKETTAFLLTDMMKDVITGRDGTAKIAQFRNIRMPIAGKTGTTTDVKDLMFVGYTPYYVASVWLGHDQNQNLKTNGQTHEVLWREIMEQVHIQKGLEYADFERPDGIITREICNISGNLASSYCSSTRNEYFASGTEPKKYCNSHAIPDSEESTGETDSNDNSDSSTDNTDNLDSSEGVPNTQDETTQKHTVETDSGGNIVIPPPTTSNENIEVTTENVTEAPPQTEETVPTIKIPETDLTTAAPTVEVPILPNDEIPISNENLDVPPSIDNFVEP